MPTPRKDESRTEFIGRCIPYIMDEGKAKSRAHAYAICNGIWEQHKTEKSDEMFSGVLRLDDVKPKQS